MTAGNKNKLKQLNPYTQLPLPQGAEPPIFGRYLLRPNGCMDQDATWCGDRPRSRRLCVRWGPRSPLHKGGRPPKVSAHVYCGETAGWIKIVLGTDVDLSPGDFLLVGNPAPSSKRGQSRLPNFWRISVVAKRLHASRWR